MPDVLPLDFKRHLHPQRPFWACLREVKNAEDGVSVDNGQLGSVAVESHAVRPAAETELLQRELRQQIPTCAVRV